MFSARGGRVENPAGYYQRQNDNWCHVDYYHSQQCYQTNCGCHDYLYNHYRDNCDCYFPHCLLHFYEQQLCSLTPILVASSICLFLLHIQSFSKGITITFHGLTIRELPCGKLFLLYIQSFSQRITITFHSQTIHELSCVEIRSQGREDSVTRKRMFVKDKAFWSIFNNFICVSSLEGGQFAAAMLEAVPCVVKERLSPSAKDRPPNVDTPFPFERGNDKVSNDSGQKLLHMANVLISGLSDVGAEITKNILSGVSAVKLNDHRIVTKEDFGAQLLK
uniref:THIF-type NAD/FAD binding fold domain-containing protein n=1 Tax=Glossina pallidipes TaxID=7398 RepID=A0A1B0AE46_GLOPL